MRPIFLLPAVLLLLIAGCTVSDNHGYAPQTQVNGDTGGSAGSGIPNSSAPKTNGDMSENPGSNAPDSSAPIMYENARSFTTFTDPNEGAFSLEVPEGWAVAKGSGLIRPYIDAAVAFEAKSPAGQGFLLQDPYGYIYATPNQMLDFAGFSEGSLYDPSGGIANPMMVREYVSAADFASELIENSGLQVSNVKTIGRPDLAQSSSPMITRQSASETTLDYSAGGKDMSMVLVIRTTLVESSGTGVWYVSGMEYYSPTELMDETELLALDMQRSFKVDPEWAARENIEVQKRLGIIAQGQSDVAAIISSTFETRSTSMDSLNEKWDNAMLGIEDVYNTETGSHYVVDSGSNYYWVDNSGNIYGTETDANPFPNEDFEKLDCPGC